MQTVLAHPGTHQVRIEEGFESCWKHFDKLEPSSAFQYFMMCKAVDQLPTL